MLMYVKKSEYSKIVGMFSTGDMPALLKGKLDTEKAIEDAKQKELAEAHLYLSLQVVTDKDITTSTSNNLDLVNFNLVQTVKILKSASFADLKVYLQNYSMFINRTFFGRNLPSLHQSSNFGLGVKDLTKLRDHNPYFQYRIQLVIALHLHFLQE